MLFTHFFFLLSLSPPTAQEIPKALTQHEDTRTDAYYWIKEKQSSAVKSYLEAENQYTDASMASTKRLQETLYQEYMQRIADSDTSVPITRKGVTYTTLSPKDKPYSVHIRGENEVFFDENVYAEGKDFFDVGSFALSDDQNLLAFSVDTAGDEIYAIEFKDLKTGKPLADRIEKTSGQMLFGADNTFLFYTTLDSAHRAYRLYRHKMGTSGEDQLLYEEKNPGKDLTLRKSRDESTLFLVSGGHLTATTFFLDAAHPEGKFCEVIPEVEGVLYSVERRHGDFYITTNASAPNFKVIVKSQAGCKVLIPEREDVSIEGVALFENYLALFEMKGGLSQMETLALDTNQMTTVNFPEPTYSLSPSGYTEFCSNTVRFSFSSLITPTTIFDYDMKKGTFEMKKRAFVGPYNPGSYVEKRFFATACDGTQIPISLVYKKGMKLKGTLLKGYGAYGCIYSPTFSKTALSLLDRGVALAIAHVRGGGEYGRRWYDAGRLFNKRNSFTDFIVAAECLIARGMGPLVIQGRSAGGLLVGASAMMRPDLFKGVVAQVPFVDVLTTMSDPTIPLTTSEYEEWGNPVKEDEYFYMKSYSPYDNVFKRNYPAMLVVAGVNDVRVSYVEPVKWVAKMRALKTDTNPLYLKTYTSGHFGSSDKFSSLEETAFVDAFILNVLEK